MFALNMKILLLVVLISFGHAKSLTGNENLPTISEDAAESLNDARFDFAIDSFRKMSEIETEDNFAYSPHNLYRTLGLAYFGSSGDTETELHKILKLPENFSKFELVRFLESERALYVLRNENSSDSYVYKSANRLWLSSDKKLQSNVTEFLGDEVQTVDLKTDPEAIINEWVSNESQGNIKDFLPKVCKDTDAVFINAVYFKGLWQNKLHYGIVRFSNFYDSRNEPIFTAHMEGKRYYNYKISENLGAQILQLPSKGDEVSMYIFLPISKGHVVSKDQTDDVSELFQRISDPSGKNVKELRDTLDNDLPVRKVHVLIPQFKLELESPIEELLMAMGAESLFNSSANFNGFVVDSEGFRLCGIKHKVNIEITNEGSFFDLGYISKSDGELLESSKDPAYFSALRPFAYIIYEKPSRSVLFAGIFRHPVLD